MADYNLQYQDTYIDALLATVNELKTAGYIYKGVATPSTNPGTPTERVAYLASEPGTYTNFGGIVITSGLYSLTYVSGTWTGTQMSAGSDIAVVQTTGQSASDVMSQKAVTDEIDNSSITYTDIPLTSIAVGNYRLTSAKKWTSSTTDKHYWLPCSAGETFRVTGNATSGFNYAFMKTHNNTANANANVCSIYTGSLPACAVNEVITITAPSDATGLALNKVVNGNDVGPSKIERVTTAKEDIADLQNEVAGIAEILGSVRGAVSAYTGLVNATDGGVVESNVRGHTEYLYTNGAKKILVYAPTLGSSAYGLAFYARKSYNTYISGVTFSGVGTNGEMRWMLIDVPEGATVFRYSTWLNTDSQYRLVVTPDYLLQFFQESAANCLATQIFRMAKAVSPSDYIYAFGISQIVIIDSKAYIRYDGNKTNLDGDTQNNTNEKCLTIVDLFDGTSTTEVMTDGTMYNADGSVTTPYSVQYETYCASPNNKFVAFAFMRFQDNNPCYSYQIMDIASTTRSFTKCTLQYTANNVQHSVDFTTNNYRQMLADLGIDSYIASATDAIDNINLHYDSTLGYYAVLCGAQGVNGNKTHPLMLMNSTDMATWSPVAYLGKKTDATEISAIYKDGIAYVSYRRLEGDMSYLIYDVTNTTLLKEGVLSKNKDLQSKPDCFIFGNDVYMAVNVDPSIYGVVNEFTSYRHDARNQIAIYKVIGDTPTLFKVVCNPTGLQYFSFMETPVEMAGSPAKPIYEHGAIYIAFSEDRRHLYRRQIAQVSFADVTALFADFGRIG